MGAGQRSPSLTASDSVQHPRLATRPGSIPPVGQNDEIGRVRFRRLAETMKSSGAWAIRAGPAAASSLVRAGRILRSALPACDGDPDGRVIDGADGALSRQHESADKPADLETRTVLGRRRRRAGLSGRKHKSSAVLDETDFQR